MSATGVSSDDGAVEDEDISAEGSELADEAASIAVPVVSSTISDVVSGDFVVSDISELFYLLWE
jgi:hypothetical protein